MSTFNAKTLVDQFVIVIIWRFVKILHELTANARIPNSILG